MNDLIEVTGKYKTIPTIQFIQKINGIVSMTGEKIHERQFMEAVEEAEKETGLKVQFYVGFADIEKSTYRFYFEFADDSITQETADNFGKVVDEKLKKINCEYEGKRVSFRVNDPMTFILQKDAFEAYKKNCIERGSRDGQFKLNLLMQDEKRHAMFKELIRK